MATKVKLIADNVITTSQIDTSSLDSHFTGGTGVTYSSGTISIGQAVHSTDSPTFADLTLTGNLNITGDINSYNVTDLDVTDQTITLGAGQTEALSGGSGIIVDGSNASILWDETNTEWDFNNPIHVNGGITFGTADSTLADNNIRFKSTGAAYIDHNTVGQDINFRVSNASSLDTTALTIDSSGNVCVGTTNDGAPGLTIDELLNLSFGTGNDNESYVNFFRQSSSAAAVMATGYRRSSTANKMESSIGTSWAKSAIAANYGQIILYTDPASADAVGTTLTPTERLRVYDNGIIGINKPSGPAVGGFGTPAIVVKQWVDSEWGGINIEANGNDSVFSLSNSDTSHIIAGSYR